jgi:hypothetical protein
MPLLPIFIFQTEVFTQTPVINNKRSGLNFFVGKDS